MINWKAIIFGWVTTVLAGLMNNLAFVLIAAYIANSKSSPLLAEYGDPLSYAIGVFGLFIAMAFGGFVTAFCARKRIVLHGAIVGFLASSTSLALSAHAGELTFVSLLFVVFATLFTVIGGLAWEKCSTYLPKAKQMG
ncbi:MAG: hypothetical protein L3J26_08580 [Candidatus Polarisedimenticolaceae bacterium]|nr:hypothetical protein [Candidatus Polarisedimenticolaceae bacterium]